MSDTLLLADEVPTMEKRRALADMLASAAAIGGAGQAALRYAALSSRFDPAAALRAVGLAESAADDTHALTMRVAVAAQLADACDTRLWHPKWIMRAAPRARILEELQPAIAEHVAWRRSFILKRREEADRYSLQICCAVLGQAQFAPEAVERTLAATSTGQRKATAAQITRLRRLLRGLTFAAPIGPSTQYIDAVRAALAAAMREPEPERELTAHFVGRERELAALRRSLKQQWAAPGTQVPFAYVSGMGGSGKSTLLARVRATERRGGAVCVMLDFDRPGIDGSDPLGLSRDIARQIAEQLGAAAAPLYAAIHTASADVGAGGEQAGRLTLDLVQAIAVVLAKADRRLLLTLDTLESLTVHGDTAAREMLAWLALLRATIHRIAVIGAGREVDPALFAGSIHPLPLDGLPDDKARAFLARRKIAGAAAKQVLAMAARNPLLLELGVRAILRKKGRTGLAARPEAEPEVRSAQLYRLILSRISDEAARRLAHPSLMLRAIDAEVVKAVVFPALELPAPADGEVEAALRLLAAQGWLVEEADGRLRHRAILRGVLLDLQIAESPVEARALFDRAAKWHADRQERDLALYYRLQAMRWAPTPPRVTADDAALIDPALDRELPEAARAVLAAARAGQPMPAGDDGAPAGDTAGVAGAFDAKAGEELLLATRARNFAEAAAMLARISDLSGVDDTGPVSAAAIEALWRGGDWDRARILLARRQAALGQVEFALAPHETLAAAQADMAPAQFRALLRQARSWGETVAEAAGRARGDPAWQTAEMLLAAEGFAVPADGFGAAVLALWTGEAPGAAALPALRAMVAAASGAAGGETAPPDGADSHAAIAALLLGDPHHAQLIRSKMLALTQAQIEQALARATASMEALPQVGVYAVDEIDRRGLLAVFASELSQTSGDADFAEISLAVGRRAATIAGHWSYGDPPAGWRHTAGGSPSAGATAPSPTDPSPLAAPLAMAARGELQPFALATPQETSTMDPDIIAAAAEESRSRLSAMPGDMREAARAAVDKGLIEPGQFGLGAGAEVFDSPLEASENPFPLEAIVLLTGRPPMLVTNDKVVIDAIARNAMDISLPMLTTAAIEGVEGFLPSIGRIEFLNHRMQWGGTGFVVEGGSGDRRRVVTNRHVAKLVAQRARDGSGIFMRSAAGPAYKAKIDMREEFGGIAGGDRECMVEKVIYLADDTEADCALLEIVTTSQFAPSPLPLASARAQVDELVAAIGYPAYDDRNEVAPMRQYFGDIFNVKRFAPGLVTQSQPGALLMHDCTTLGGNSGSPLVSLTQKAVVGLHFSGRFGQANSAVSVETLRQLQTGRLFAVTETMPALEEMPADREHTATDLADRKGYDPAFLGTKGLRVDPPGMDTATVADLAKPSDALPGRPNELRYTNFGVWYSAARRQPRFTAVNIDGERSKRIKRTVPDVWYFDLRIARELQLGKAHFAGDVDRGHLVRREDPAFGRHAQRAADDTFHYTNCALQHAVFNRGHALWNGLEAYILGSARTQGFRACVFTGPILAPDDPALGIEDIAVPREFWKIIAMPGADGKGLHATGYLLSQGDLIRKLLEDRTDTTPGGNEAASEGFVLGEYRTFQIAIANIETATGLRFPALAAADPLAACANEAISPVTYAPIETLEGIVL